MLGMSFEGESVGLACAGGQGPNLHLPFGNGARHAQLQVGTIARFLLFQDAEHAKKCECLRLRLQNPSLACVCRCYRIEEEECRIVLLRVYSPVVVLPSPAPLRCRYGTAVHDISGFLPPCHVPQQNRVIPAPISPDDVFLLTSAVDNEVKQYLALDGRLHMDLEIPKTGMDENFTRSYYTSSGRWDFGG